MSVLDDVLRMFGTNRVRLRWKWEAMRRKAREGVNAAAPRPMYEHKACPRCGNILDKSERVCPTCGAPQRGPVWDKVRRATRAFVPEGAFSATGIVFAINFLVFAAMLAVEGAGALGVPEVETLDRFGAWTVGTVQAGEAWRLLTANFVHIGALHILMNSMALAQVAPVVEFAYGRQRFFALYVFSGVGGMASSYAWRLYTGENPIVAGASASIFGMIGVAATYFFLARRRDLGGIFVRWAVTALVLSFLLPADNMAHFGGLVFGALGALALGTGRPLRALGARVWSAVEIALLLAVAGSFGLAWRARSEGWRVSAYVQSLEKDGVCAGEECARMEERLRECMADTGIRLEPGVTEDQLQQLWTCIEQKGWR